MDPRAYPIPPQIVAVAKDKTVKSANAFGDPDLPTGVTPAYGQDLTFGRNRKPPLGHDVGQTEAALKPKMEKLLGIFASGDKSGMAKRIFAQYLAKKTAISYFDDPDLTAAANNHPHINYFCMAALAAPGYPPNCGAPTFVGPGNERIHQALRQAHWDLRCLRAPMNLGVPAFNQGWKWTRSGDFNNGLGVMINGVQFVYILATHYHYDKTSNTYGIVLQYRFYDVFGLDDDDLKEYGAKASGLFNTDAGVGITAWWQLQHQHAYAPLVTRIIIERSYVIRTMF